MRRAVYYKHNLLKLRSADRLHPSSRGRPGRIAKRTIRHATPGNFPKRTMSMQASGCCRFAVQPLRRANHKKPVALPPAGVYGRKLANRGARCYRKMRLLASRMAGTKFADSQCAQRSGLSARAPPDVILRSRLLPFRMRAREFYARRATREREHRPSDDSPGAVGFV